MRHVIVHFEKVEQETFKASKVFGGRSREMRGKVETFADRETLKLNDLVFSLLNSSERHSLLQCEENRVVDELPAVEFIVRSRAID